MLKFKKLLREVKEKKYRKEGQKMWIFPGGNEITIDKSHTGYVLENPDIFDIGNVNDSNVEEKMKNLYMKGWIKSTVKEGEKVFIKGTEESIEDKMYIFYDRAPKFELDIVNSSTGQLERTEEFGAFDFGQKKFISEILRR